MIVHGRKEIISQCDHILTIIDNKCEIGILNDYTSKIPHKGDIYVIELDNPNEEILNKLAKFEANVVITERQHEKYKIFTEEDPDIFMQKIIKIAGSHLYSFKKYKANFNEYLEFLEENKKII